MATASVATQRTGVIAISDTIADNYITLQGGTPMALYVYLDHGSAGSFSYPAADSGAVPLPSATWVEVWRREGRGGDGPCTVYFASPSGSTPDLHYRVTS